MDPRTITWDGFHNARDLGGLPTRDGRTTAHGTLIRSADLRLVTPTGWHAAHTAGVRTIVDLRNDDEVNPYTEPGPTTLAGSAALPAAATTTPPGMHRIQVPLDGVEDIEFWRHLNHEQLNGTPLYYRPFLHRKPDRVAAVMTTIARAEPGAVIFHCGAGRDRTGLITMLLLALAGVEPDTIADDYELTHEPLRALFAALGRESDHDEVTRALAGHSTTARDAVLSTLDGLDAGAYLLDAGVIPDDLDRLLARLLG